MPRRRRKESDFEALLRAPWPVSAGLAGTAFFVTQVVFPAFFGSGPLAMALLPLAKTGGLFLSAIFALAALLAFIKARQQAAQGVALFSEPTISDRRPPAWASLGLVDKAWDNSLSDSRPTGAPLKPTAWSLELLRQIEWKRVEELVAAYFREKSFRTETLTCGPDGGVDVKLFVNGKSVPFAVVQCKAWNSQKVGVKPVRELLGVMASEKIAKGIFVATGDFTEDATVFAKGNPINLITGDMLFNGITALDPDAQQRLLAVATEGDYLTPTCASCGIKMVRKEGKNGGFWGCRNFPKCRAKLFI